jgi:hypothetical protein
MRVSDQDPKAEVERIARFLNVPFDSTLIADIANKCSFDNMKAAHVDIKKDTIKELVRESMAKRGKTPEVTEDTHAPTSGNQDTQMSSTHFMYRKGNARNICVSNKSLIQLL